MNREEFIGVRNTLLELARGQLLENGSKVALETRRFKVLIYTNFLFK
jgi:DNA-binding winged helix-turn-helix (wHTH) protein